MITKRRHLPIAPRRVSYVSPSADMPVDFGRGGHVYVTGKPPTTAELIERFAGREGVDLYLDGHYPVVRNAGRDEAITWAGAWWGEDATAAECAQAHSWLAAAIASAWREPLTLMLTPATTGRDLWVRTVPREGIPVLSEEAQRLIRSTSGQGRIETLPGRLLGPARAHLYDARLAYTACLRNMPVGEPVVTEYGGHLFDVMADAGEYEPYRALVRWRAPAGWDRPGILPAMAADGWAWPTEGEGWVDGAELLIARRHGWRIETVRTLTYPERGDVFRTWNDRLTRILRDAGRLDRRSAELIRRAIRAIILHAVGAFHGRPHKRTGIGEADAVPEGAESVRVLASGLCTWVTMSPPAWPQLSHPEWTSAIWARARARLLDTNGVGALHCKPGTVLGFRTDAILTTAHMEWPDNGRAGQYRLKGTTVIDRWPASNVATLAIKNECEAG